MEQIGSGGKTVSQNYVDNLVHEAIKLMKLSDEWPVQMLGSCSSTTSSAVSVSEDGAGGGSRSRERKSWQKYYLKSEKLPGSYGHPYPIMRAYDRCNNRAVVVELIPRECVLRSLFPLKKTQLLKKISLQHPCLVSVQDMFYCSEFGCECLVYECPMHAQTLGQVLRRGRRLDAREARVIFRQVVLGVKFLMDAGYQINEITVDDLLFWEDASTHKIRVQIMYLKFAHSRLKSGSFTILEPPEKIFPELQLPQYDPTFVNDERVVWHLGVILYQTCTRCRFQTEACNQKNLYIDLLDELSNQLSNVRLWESEEQHKLVSGLMAYDIGDRWCMEDVLQHPWVCFGSELILMQTNNNNNTVDRSLTQFLVEVRKQLTCCVLDSKNVGFGADQLEELVQFNKEFVVPALEELVGLCYEENADEAKNLKVSDKVPMRTIAQSKHCNPRCCQYHTQSTQKGNQLQSYQSQVLQCEDVPNGEFAKVCEKAKSQVLPNLDRAQNLKGDCLSQIPPFPKQLSSRVASTVLSTDSSSSCHIVGDVMLDMDNNGNFSAASARDQNLINNNQNKQQQVQSNRGQVKLQQQCNNKNKHKEKQNINQNLFLRGVKNALCLCWMSAPPKETFCSN